MNSGASRKVRDTDRSTPSASATAYDVARGTMAAASAEAPSRPMPKSVSALAPATGSRAWAASAAEFSGPEPPMAAAVAMMIAIDTTLAKMAPVMVSTLTFL